MTGDQLIAELKSFTGGLNWLDELPAPNEFKALEGWENWGNYLRGMLGRTDVNATTINSADVALRGIGKYKASTGDEYVAFVSDDDIYAVKTKGTGAGTATTWVWNTVLDLSDAAVTVASMENDGSQVLALQDRVHMFIDSGYNDKNLVLEYDTSKASDFRLRSMGISAATTFPSVSLTTATPNISGKYRYKTTWVRKSGSTDLSESGGNTAAAASTWYTETVVTNQQIVVSIPATTSDAQVTHARLYRTRDLNNPNNSADGDAIKYHKLTDIAVAGGAVSSVYTDKMTDEALWQQSASDILWNEYYQPLPKCKHATFLKGRVWCSDGSKVYFTSGNQHEAGLETYDPRFDFLDAKFDDGEDVTGIYAQGGNVQIIKETKTGIVVDGDPFNGIQWTDSKTGSVYKRSFAYTPWGLMALTNRGVRIHDGVRWGAEDLSMKIIKQNYDDPSKRIYPISDPNSNTTQSVAAFYYNGKYVMSIWGDIGTGQGYSNYVMVFDPNFGWSQAPVNYWFFVASTYDNDTKVVSFKNANTRPMNTLFTGNTDDGTAITGVVQPGYIHSKDEFVEINKVKAFATLSNAASLIIKQPDAVHDVATDLTPEPPDNLFNRYYYAEMPGYKTGIDLACKFKGNIDKNSVFRGYNIYGKLVSDFGDTNRFTTGLVARYPVSTIAGNVLQDRAGKGLDLSFSNNAAALTTSALNYVRTPSVVVTNAAAEVCGFYNTTGYPLDAYGEWSLVLYIRPRNNGSNVDILTNKINGQEIQIIWNPTKTNLRMLVGTKGKTIGNGITSGGIHTLFLRYKYLKGTYGTDLDFDLELERFTSGIWWSFTSSLSTGTASVTTGGTVIMGSGNNKFLVDEIRIYNRAITYEEAIGMGDEYYIGNVSKHEYF